MNVCLAGCGSISKCHLAAIEKMKENGANLVAVCDIVKEKADKAAEKFGCKAYYSYNEMLENEDADVVHICTPHYLHVDMAIKALAKNINVVLEKPCATSSEELKRLEAAADCSDSQLAVCFQNRYNPTTVFAKNFILSGEYGSVTGARAFVTWNRDKEYYSLGEWRGTRSMECGGVLINQAIHTHDLLMYLIGKDTYSVDGKIANFHLKNHIEVEDTACVYFTFTDSTRAVYYATTAAGVNSSPLIDIYFENAALRIEDDCVFLIDKKSGSHKLLFNNKQQDSVFVGKKEWGGGHFVLISEFYDCIKNKKHFPIDVRQAGRAVTELLAAYESSEKNETIYLSR